MYSYYITPQEYDEALKHGIPAETLEKRIRSYGWEKARAIITPVRSKMKLEKKWVNIAAKNGIPYNTFLNRVKVLGNQELAATLPHKNRSVCGKHLAESHRILPRNLIELARLNGISNSALCNRIRKYGWDPERAATQPVERR